MIAQRGRRVFTHIPRISLLSRTRSHAQQFQNIMIARSGKKKPDQLASFIDMHVVAPGNRGTPRSVVFHLADNRLLFNCGDGAQRILNEQRLKINTIDHVFITKRTWKNLGGILGLCLSMIDISKPGYDLHGPPNVEMVTENGKRYFETFDGQQRFKIVKHEVTERVYENKNFRVEYVPMFPTIAEPSAPDSPASKKRKVGFFGDSEMSVIYVLKPAPKVRSVSMEKCVEAGIKSGPMVGLLKKGQEVTLPNGKVVKPDDVLLPELPSGVAIVLECPSPRYLDSLTQNERLRTLQTAQEGGEPVVLVVHMTPEHVVQEPQYQDWIKGFGKSTKHVILNDKCNPVSLVSAHYVQEMLHRIHPVIFPLLHDPTSQGLKGRVNTEQQIVYGETGLSYVMRPTSAVARGFNKSMCMHLVERKEKEREASLSETAFKKACEELQKQIEDEEFKKADYYDHFKDKDYPEIVFLGTGSSKPSSSRNVSAVLVHTSPDDCVLLDVGENTDGQIYRHYGLQAEEVFRELKAVYVSHLHFDHHLGLLSVVRARQAAFKAAGLEPPLLEVVAPANLVEFLVSLEESGIKCRHLLSFTPVEDLLSTSELRDAKHEKICKHLNLSGLNVVPVHHRMNPYGVRLDHQDGWSLSYSGDTVPCRNFVDLSRDVDIMIHEATMEEAMIDDAHKKRHSTTAQAISVGYQARAKFVLLTHFSQRYAKIPYMKEDFPTNVGIAFDNMRIRPRDLAVLPLLTPALKALFMTYMEDLEEKKDRRERIKQADRYKERMEIERRAAAEEDGAEADAAAAVVHECDAMAPRSVLHERGLVQEEESSKPQTVSQNNGVEAKETAEDEAKVTGSSGV